LTAGALLVTGLAVSQKNTTPEAMLRAAMDKETVDGDLKAAIEQYKKVIAQKGASREVVAQALLRLGEVYERQGSAEARPSYQRVVSEFADQSDPAQQARARLEALGSGNGKGPTFRVVWTAPAGVGDPSISPDGRYLSYNTGNGELDVRDLVTGQTRLVAPAGVAGAMAWSRDGKRLAYQTSSKEGGLKLNLVNTDGAGKPTSYSFKGETEAAPEAWSPDGKRILISDVKISPSVKDPITSKLLWVQAADGAVQPIATSASPLPFQQPSLSPDGRYIAFAGIPKGNTLQDAGATQVYLIASDGAGETVISEAFGDDPIGWTPDGKYVLTTRNRGASLWAIPVAGGKAQGPAVSVRSEFGSDSGDFIGVTRGGSLYYRIVVNTTDSFLASMDSETGKITSAPNSQPFPRSAGGLWSPDGRRILHPTTGQPAVEPGPDTTGLSIYSLDSGKDQRVASNIVVLRRGVCWGPDGASILLNRPRGLTANESEPVRFNLSTGEVTPLFPGASSFTIRTCSDELVSDFSNTAVKVRNLKTGAETEIHKYERRQPVQSSPFLSHNGRWVAFREVLQDGSAVLYVVSSGGGPARELARAKPPATFNNPRGLSWSPDERFVYFFRKSDSNAPSELFRVPASGGAEESTGLKGLGFGGGEIAPDGKHILFGANSQQTEIWPKENFPPAAK